MKNEVKNETNIIRWIVYAGFLFSLIEIVMAFYANSQAILMDSIYDTAEAVVLALVVFLIPLLYKPVSERKPYGYSQIESFLILGKGIMLVTVTIGLIFANVQMMMHGGNTTDPALIGMFEIILSMLSIVILALLLYKGKRIQSPLFDAEIVGWKIDVASSIGVSAAFFFSSLLKDTAFQGIVPYFDQIIAILIACVMLPQPLKMIYQSIKELVLFAPKEEVMEQIKEVSEALFKDYAYETVFYDVVLTGRKLWIEIYIRSVDDILRIHQLECIKTQITQELIKTYTLVDVQITPNL